RHRDHLDRQWERPERANQLAVIDQTDEAAGSGGDDLLARKGGATPFDETPFTGRFIGAVEVLVQNLDVVEIHDGYAKCFQTCGRGAGAGDCAGNALADGAQSGDEVVYRRAGADADDLAVLDVIEGGERRAALLVVAARHGRSAVAKVRALSLSMRIAAFQNDCARFRGHS